MRGNGIHMSKNMRVFYALHSNRFKRLLYVFEIILTFDIYS